MDAELSVPSLTDEIYKSRNPIWMQNISDTEISVESTKVEIQYGCRTPSGGASTCPHLQK